MYYYDRDQGKFQFTTDERRSLQKRTRAGFAFQLFLPGTIEKTSFGGRTRLESSLDENFLLIYNCDFEPNKTYQVILNVEK